LSIEEGTSYRGTDVILTAGQIAPMAPRPLSLITWR